MRVLVSIVSFSLVAAIGCKRTESSVEPPASASATASKVPHVKFSDQARLTGGRGDAGPRPRGPNPEAVATGAKLHEGVSKQCKNDTCKHEKCGPLCAQWLREKVGDGGATLAKNSLYFDCIGSCMFGMPDGGAR